MSMYARVTVSRDTSLGTEGVPSCGAGRLSLLRRSRSVGLMTSAVLMDVELSSRVCRLSSAGVSRELVGAVVSGLCPSTLASSRSRGAASDEGALGLGEVALINSLMSGSSPSTSGSSSDQRLGDGVDVMGVRKDDRVSSEPPTASVDRPERTASAYVVVVGAVARELRSAWSSIFLERVLRAGASTAGGTLSVFFFPMVV